MTIGEKLKEMMQWNGIKQEALSKATGISKSMISEYVRDVRIPTLEALEQLASALDVSVWAIINGDPLAVDPSDVTEDERQLIGKYRVIRKRDQEIIDFALDRLIER